MIVPPVSNGRQGAQALGGCVFTVVKLTLRVAVGVNGVPQYHPSADGLGGASGDELEFLDERRGNLGVAQLPTPLLPPYLISSHAHTALGSNARSAASCFSSSLSGL